jgi:TorA maturation chaperone TorD
MTGTTMRTADALAAAAEWRLLGLLLERPRAELRAEIGALAAETRDPALRDAAAGVVTSSEGEYLALLGPGGLASPREAAYLGMQDPAWVLAEIARFYDVFAFAPRAEDPPDHVAVEAAFVAYLHLKEAFALEAGDAEAAETTRAARTRFVAEHLARIARAMADRLAPALGTPLARAALQLAARVPPPPAGTTVAPHDDDGPATCGACGTTGRS